MSTKSFTGLQVKDAEQGTFTAVFSTFNVVDKHGDVTLPGAFAEGAEVTISAYGHGSWEGRLPVGKGVVHSNDREAWVDGQFFLATTAGRETFLTVKELGARQEWSYSVEPEKLSYGEFDGRDVTFLEKLHGPTEVSPVLRGAGVNTRTTAVKSARVVPAPRGPVATHDADTAARPWDSLKTVAALPADLRPSQLRTVYAWVDPGGDPELKSSYRLPHHHGVGGPANVRACLAGIAEINAGKTALPEGDVQGVYDHLASHLRDADREPPPLRTGGVLKMNDEAALVLADLAGLIDRVAEVGASRAQKGKGLTRSTVEILGWISDELDRLKSVLADPQMADEGPSADDIHTLMRAVALVNEI